MKLYRLAPIPAFGKQTQYIVQIIKDTPTKLDLNVLLRNDVNSTIKLGEFPELFGPQPWDLVLHFDKERIDEKGRRLIWNSKFWGGGGPDVFFLKELRAEDIKMLTAQGV